jgi:hypothetical protein
MQYDPLHVDIHPTHEERFNTYALSPWLFQPEMGPLFVHHVDGSLMV